MTDDLAREAEALAELLGQLARRAAHPRVPADVRAALLAVVREAREKVEADHDGLLFFVCNGKRP